MDAGQNPVHRPSGCRHGTTPEPALTDQLMFEQDTPLNFGRGPHDEAISLADLGLARIGVGRAAGVAGALGGGA